MSVHEILPIEVPIEVQKDKKAKEQHQGFQRGPPP